MLAKIEFFGGPLDGETQTNKLIDEPCRLPLFVHEGKKRRRYIYQARRFIETDESLDRSCDDEGDPLPMDFVQILMPGDDL